MVDDVSERGDLVGLSALADETCCDVQCRIRESLEVLRTPSNNIPMNGPQLGALRICREIFAAQSSEFFDGRLLHSLT